MEPFIQNRILSLLIQRERTSFLQHQVFSEYLVLLFTIGSWIFKITRCTKWKYASPAFCCDALATPIAEHRALDEGQFRQIFFFQIKFRDVCLSCQKSSDAPFTPRAATHHWRWSRDEQKGVNHLRNFYCWYFHRKRHRIFHSFFPCFILFIANCIANGIPPGGFPFAVSASSVTSASASASSAASSA